MKLIQKTTDQYLIAFFLQDILHPPCQLGGEK